jgi:hypothetical protein
MGYKKGLPPLQKALGILVRPAGIEPAASWFEARRSVRLSYGRTQRIDVRIAAYQALTG